MIKTLIIEDEAPAAERLKKLLKEVEPGVKVLETIDSVSSAIKWFQGHSQPDLLLLDIQLGDGLSFDIFNQVKIESFVIFTTAYDEYAIKAFELNSIDYLLKPINRDKLKKSIEKFLKLQGAKSTMNIQEVIAALDRERRTYKKRFSVNVGTKIRSIETSSIAYFYSLDKTTFLCTKEDRHYPIDYSLDTLDELIDPLLFFRINRQYTIQFDALDKINVLSRSRVYIITIPPTEQPLLVSTGRTHEFRLWLDR